MRPPPESTAPPGDTNGRGSDAFGAKWLVLNASGDKVEGPQSGSPILLPSEVLSDLLGESGDGGVGS
ncbi:hypothetical protein [Streptomyces sp. NPDC101393]|uniref:hypothetical protein n=1 Tax=Streptomyces sp. NPDC101393 TaxID=3366141 RepID=UPI00382BBDE7